MEELNETIRQRFERVNEVVKGVISSDRFRLLKEEEKARCEKQNFLLSMMRANKAAQVLAKNLYFKYSYEIMRKINPEFECQMDMDRLEDNFLNDFVVLYRHFFSKYEEMFNFKLKLQNLIRPTNHNLIIDLVRYLVDFSRDYYQQTFFWYMKTNYKTDKIQEEDKEQEETKQDGPEQQSSKKRIERASLNELVLQRELSKKQSESDPKKDPQKNYEILDITGFPAMSVQTKDSSTNIQVLKFRINELYRDLKSRNQILKSHINSYYLRYNGQNTDLKQRQYTENENDTINQATHPFRLSLNIEKNGYNFISVSYIDPKNYNKNKEKQLSPVKASQRLMPALELRPKAEFMTSMKVIRISDNFLPPLLGLNFTTPSSPVKEKTKSFQLNEGTLRINLLSSNSAANQEQIQRKMKKQSQHHAAISSNAFLDSKMVKEKSYRKLTELKRNFKSEQKKEGGILINSNNANTNPNDPQKKIFDWLQKLRQVKQIERKKIMGLS